MAVLLNKRRVRCFLLGLFVIAQLVGVVPLLATHTLDVFDRQQVMLDVHGLGSIDKSDHHPGSGCCDQCCTLSHHLVGVVGLPFIIAQAVVRVTRVAPRPLARLTSGGPFLLDRPPKILSLI